MGNQSSGFGAFLKRNSKVIIGISIVILAISLTVVLYVNFTAQRIKDEMGITDEFIEELKDGMDKATKDLSNDLDNVEEDSEEVE